MRSAHRSGVQIGNAVTLELHDHVLQHQLSLLETFQHDLIHFRIVRKLGNDTIQIPMFDAQVPEAFDTSEDFGFDLFVH